MAESLANLEELPDFSEWLTEERFRHEETEWERQRLFERYAQAITEMKPISLLECGCGSGWIPWQMEQYGFGCAYVGLDSNLFCIQAAHLRNPGKLFLYDDIRSLPKPGFHMVCSFAVLKHFGLDEWDDIFQRFLATAPLAVFTMNVLHPHHKVPFDEGTEWHHTWLTDQRLADAVHLAGHYIIKQEVASPAEHGNEMLIWTKKPSKLVYEPGSPMSS